MSRCNDERLNWWTVFRTAKRGDYESSRLISPGESHIFPKLSAGEILFRYTFDEGIWTSSRVRDWLHNALNPYEVFRELFRCLIC
jgi:hypothetical protein